MMYTKELLFSEFKEVTKKDERSKKPSYKHRIAYLQSLKEDFDKTPKNFSNINISSEQLQNLIDDWSAPKPIDAFYKRGFGMTYAEYYDLSKGEKVYMKKKLEDTDTVH